MASSLIRLWFRTSVLVVLAACQGKAPPAATPPASPGAALEIVELQPGTGALIGPGQKAVMKYTGWLYETAAPDHKGKQFDSTEPKGEPFRFVVGAGQVIKGWDQGIAGMRVGGRRRLTIAPELGYGDVGAGDVIPPGATLIFDVELLSIE